MISERTAKLLWDVQDNLGSVADFIKDKTEADYLASNLLRSAVERKLQNTGEALARMRRSDPETARRFPDLHSIIGFRNFLVHGYDEVSNERVWEFANAEAPAVGKSALEMLDAYERAIEQGTTEGA